MTYEELDNLYSEYLVKALEMMKEVGLYKLLPDDIYCVLHKGYRGKTIAEAMRFENGWYELRFCIKYFEKWVKEGNEEQILNTLLHEFCHMLPNCLNHGEHWKYNVGLLNKKFNMDIQRLGVDIEL